MAIFNPAFSPVSVLFREYICPSAAILNSKLPAGRFLCTPSWPISTSFRKAIGVKSSTGRHHHHVRLHLRNGRFFSSTPHPCSSSISSMSFLPCSRASSTARRPFRTEEIVRFGSKSRRRIASMWVFPGGLSVLLALTASASAFLQVLVSHGLSSRSISRASGLLYSIAMRTGSIHCTTPPSHGQTSLARFHAPSSIKARSRTVFPLRIVFSMGVSPLSKQ
ncbi:hypothetical protein HDK90DRAFT_491516 [Phyllosticta capitalensis]|uniref:Uncharacterized protein n=1 Tax=Phyllosticta capitalensis TaxID=121624 RepID=A0ABR1YIC8_9PEZI